MMLRISTLVPSASCPVGDVELPPFVRLLGLEPYVAAFRCLCGWGATKPRAVSSRQIVETAGVRPWRCWR